MKYLESFLKNGAKKTLVSTLLENFWLKTFIALGEEKMLKIFGRLRAAAQLPPLPNCCSCRQMAPPRKFVNFENW